MTTVAFKDGVLAVDRQSTRGELKGRVSKLHKSALWVYAASGSLADAKLFWNGMVTGRGVFGLSPGCHGIVIDRETGEAFSVEGPRGVLILIEDEFFATGSGEDFATAAMACGLTAREAVKLASRFDRNTSSAVDSYELATP